jgi:hypothetical protein
MSLIAVTSGFSEVSTVQDRAFDGITTLSPPGL